MLWAAVFIINGAGLVGSMPSAGSPENITIMFMSPSSVKVSWTTSIEHVDKYDVTYKPTDASYRVVAVVAGNSDSVTLSGLLADTQYQITVTAVRDGKKFKSRPIVFRTLEPPRTNEVQLTPPGARGPGGGGGGGARPIPPLTNMPPTYIQVRGVEVAIVVLVLMVWVAAIILFFNRWGKIRMLLPYQPDYKDTQLKVPGTGACASTGTCQNQPVNTFCCSQRHLHHFMSEDIPGWRRSHITRSRINSAVYLAHSSGEQDPLMPPDAINMRRAKSAGNLRDRQHDSEFERHDSDRQDSEFCHQDSEASASGHHFELPILSISEATEKPFVEQHL